MSASMSNEYDLPQSKSGCVAAVAEHCDSASAGPARTLSVPSRGLPENGIELWSAEGQSNYPVCWTPSVHNAQGNSERTLSGNQSYPVAGVAWQSNARLNYRRLGAPTS